MQFRLSNDRFPPGTSVGAYLGSREWPSAGTPPATQGPKSAPVDTKAVSAAGVATFTGLDPDETYWAVAEVSGEWRWVRFRTGPSQTAHYQVEDPEDVAFRVEIPADSSSDAFEIWKGDTLLFSIDENGVLALQGVSADGRPLQLEVNAVQAGNFAAAYTLDVDGETETWLVGTLTDDLDLTLANVEPGATVRLFLTQDATGSRTLTVSDGAVSTELPLNTPGGATTAIAIYSPDGEELIFAGGGLDPLPEALTASYTFAAADAGRTLEFHAAAAVTATIPLDSAADFTIGDEIYVIQTGYGQVRFVPAVGVTLRSRGKFRGIRARYGKATLKKRAANDWELIGDLGTTRAFDPLLDCPNLLAYYKADNIAGADGDVLATWADSSDNGYDLTQATVGRRPVLKTNVVNGHKIVRFDRTAVNWIQHATLPGTGKTTVYFVGKETTRVTGATQVPVGRAAASEGKLTVSSGGTFFPGGSGAVGEPVPNPVDWFVGVGVFNSNRSIAQVNFDEAVIAQDIDVTAIGFTVGADFSGGNPFGGDIEEVIVCSGVHDEETRHRIVEALLAVVGQENA